MVKNYLLLIMASLFCLCEMQGFAQEDYLESFLEVDYASDNAEARHEYLLTARIPADPYALNIAEIQAQGHVIKMTDGSLWGVLENNDYPDLIVVQTWQAGDTVQLSCSGHCFKHNKKMHYDMFNLRNGTKIRVWLEFVPPEAKIKYITEMNSRGTWIILDDGSKWSISWWQSWESGKWAVGNPIIIGKIYKNNNYFLINTATFAGKNVEATLDKASISSLESR